MIEENRNGRLQFIGKPEVGDTAEYEGHKYKYEKAEKDGRGSFLKDGVSVRMMPIVEKSDWAE